jgi:hypothetical protein
VRAPRWLQKSNCAKRGIIGKEKVGGPFFVKKANACQAQWEHVHLRKFLAKKFTVASREEGCIADGSLLLVLQKENTFRQAITQSPARS